MPGQEAQAIKLDLLQDYVKLIMDILEVILKESPSNYKYLIELSQRITTQLQEQFYSASCKLKFHLNLRHHLHLFSWI